MAVLSKRDIERFTPPGSGDAVYLIAPAGFRERAAFRREMSACGAIYHSDRRMLQVEREGVLAVVETDAHGPLLDLLDAAEAACDDDEGLRGLDAQSLADINDLETTLRAHYKPYAQMESDRAYYLELAPLVAAAHFLRGWEGVSVAFERRGGVVPDAVLEQLPDGHLEAVGWRAVSLMSPSKAQEKNSASPLRSVADPATSAAETDHATADPDGICTETSIQQTLAS